MSERLDETLGLILIEDFITPDRELDIEEEIKSAKWLLNRSKTRRVQVYGAFHDKKYKVYENSPITPHPPYSLPLRQEILDYLEEHYPQHNVGNELLEERTELFVNEYNKGDMLHYHFDHKSNYGKVIFGISLLSDATFWLMHPKTKVKRSIVVPRRSLFLLTGPSRFTWKHGLEKIDHYRLSLTFRTIAKIHPPSSLLNNVPQMNNDNNDNNDNYDDDKVGGGDK